MPMAVLFAVGWSNSQPDDETVGLPGVPKAIVSAVSVMLPLVELIVPSKLELASTPIAGALALMLMSPVAVLSALFALSMLMPKPELLLPTCPLKLMLPKPVLLTLILPVPVPAVSRMPVLVVDGVPAPPPPVPLNLIAPSTVPILTFAP